MFVDSCDFMNELFKFYSKKYKVEWELENEIFYLYFNDDKNRLYVSDDIIYLEKYNKMFRYWKNIIRFHVEDFDSIKDVIDSCMNNKIYSGIFIKSMRLKDCVVEIIVLLIIFLCYILFKIFI
jgi:hypothetical protein